MKKTVNLVAAYHFDVFCCLNDYAIKCGGPTTLGYDFYVNGEDTKNREKFKKLIESLLKKHKRYYQSISISRINEYREDQLWSEEDIEKEIKRINPNS